MEKELKKFNKEQLIEGLKQVGFPIDMFKVMSKDMIIYGILDEGDDFVQDFLNKLKGGK